MHVTLPGGLQDQYSLPARTQGPPTVTAHIPPHPSASSSSPFPFLLPLLLPFIADSLVRKTDSFIFCREIWKFTRPLNPESLVFASRWGLLQGSIHTLLFCPLCSTFWLFPPRSIPITGPGKVMQYLKSLSLFSQNFVTYDCLL